MKEFYSALTLSFTLVAATPALADTCNFFSKSCAMKYAIDANTPTIDINFFSPSGFGASVEQSYIDPDIYNFSFTAWPFDGEFWTYNFTLDMNKNPISSSIDQHDVGDKFSSLQFIIHAASKQERIGIDVLVDDELSGLYDSFSLSSPRMFFDFSLNKTASLSEKLDARELFVSTFTSAAYGNPIIDDRVLGTAEFRSFVAPVPLPAGALLLSTALAGMMLIGRRRKTDD